MEFTAKIATPGQPVHPGETLRDRIVELGMTPREFAQQTGLSPIRLNQIIACKQSVTADVAVLISGQSGQNAEFWMNLQTAYDLAIATQGSTEGTEEVLDGELKAPFKTIVELSSDEARMFLLKAESYCTIDLPDYIQFNELLDSVINALRMHDPNTTLARQHDDVNHIIMTNKDGKYAWRPLELVHPVLYVCLAQQVTESRHWDTIIDRFAHFAQDEKVQCVSLPVQSLTDESDKAQQIRQWRVSMEQKSIELSLDYDYCAQTDIVDCYPSIYTHSVAWALHGKSVAKTKRSDRTLIGNIIDRLLQDMHLGQTNGIPQGSVLMDFIAEMVLGYADVELSSRCSGDGINDYRILRYRDDYRIFVNNPSDGDRILKHLTEVLIDLGLKLNPAKTGFSANVIHSSVKDDKLDWIFKKHRARGLQNWLLMIHDHGLNHPNSGQLVGALASVHNRLHRRGRLSSPMPLIAIVVDIAIRNPRTYPHAAAILGELIQFIEDDWDKLNVIKRVQDKFVKSPNTGYMDIWLQRITFQSDPNISFQEPLCQLVSGAANTLWNNGWISDQGLLGAIDPRALVNDDRLSQMPSTISPEEIALFESGY